MHYKILDMFAAHISKHALIAHGGVKVVVVKTQNVRSTTHSPPPLRPPPSGAHNRYASHLLPYDCALTMDGPVCVSFISVFPRKSCKYHIYIFDGIERLRHDHDTQFIVKHVAFISMGSKMLLVFLFHSFFFLPLTFHFIFISFSFSSSSPFSFPQRPSFRCRASVASQRRRSSD